MIIATNPPSIDLSSLFHEGSRFHAKYSFLNITKKNSIAKVPIPCPR